VIKEFKTKERHYILVERKYNIWTRLDRYKSVGIFDVCGIRKYMSYSEIFFLKNRRNILGDIEDFKIFEIFEIGI